jgi:hypothetical protein
MLFCPVALAALAFLPACGRLSGLKPLPQKRLLLERRLPAAARAPLF